MRGARALHAGQLPGCAGHGQGSGALVGEPHIGALGRLQPGIEAPPGLQCVHCSLCGSLPRTTARSAFTRCPFCAAARLTSIIALRHTDSLYHGELTCWVLVGMVVSRCIVQGHRVGCSCWQEPHGRGSLCCEEGGCTGCTGWLVRQRGAQTPLAASSRRSSAAAVSFLLASSSP